VGTVSQTQTAIKALNPLTQGSQRRMPKSSKLI
jgi:hypothetical protein